MADQSIVHNQELHEYTYAHSSIIKHIFPKAHAKVILASNNNTTDLATSAYN